MSSCHSEPGAPCGTSHPWKSQSGTGIELDAWAPGRESAHRRILRSSHDQVTVLATAVLGFPATVEVVPASEGRQSVKTWFRVVASPLRLMA